MAISALHRCSLRVAMVSAPPGRGRCGTRSFLRHFCDNIAYLFSSAGFCTTRCETDDKTIIIRQGRLGINVTEAQENGVFLCVQVIIGAAVGEEMPVAPAFAPCPCAILAGHPARGCCPARATSGRAPRETGRALRGRAVRKKPVAHLIYTFLNVYVII